MKTATSKKTKAQTIDKANNLQLPGIPALQFVPLELIETAPQIRTEFDQVSIEELAGDIKARGMLQPVLLRPLPSGKFLMIAGERRLRAARFAELDNIPALIGEVDDQTAALMQLAENIHREELAMMDECRAIEKLYDTLGSLDKVADMVKKSKSWCSKRYAMTKPDLHYSARKLLEDGITEDIELLKAFSTLSNIVDWKEISEWQEKITKGEAGRNEIRAALKAIKEKLKADKEKADDREKVSHAKPKEPPTPPPWTLDNAMDELEEALHYIDLELRGADLLNSWTAEQQSQIVSRLANARSIGSSEDGFKTISDLILNECYGTPYNKVDLAAMVWGFGNKLFDIDAFLAQLQQPKEAP